MPFKKINMKNYGFNKCEKNYKKWRKCIDKQKISNKPCLNKYMFFYFCNKKIKHPKKNL